MLPNYKRHLEWHLKQSSVAEKMIEIECEYYKTPIFYSFLIYLHFAYILITKNFVNVASSDDKNESHDSENVSGVNSVLKIIMGSQQGPGK